MTRYIFFSVFKIFANVIQLEYGKIICPSLKPLAIYFFYSEQKEGTVFDLWKWPRGELWLRSGHRPQDSWEVTESSHFAINPLPKYDPVTEVTTHWSCQKFSLKFLSSWNNEAIWHVDYYSLTTTTTILSEDYERNRNFSGSQLLLDDTSVANLVIWKIQHSKCQNWVSTHVSVAANAAEKVIYLQAAKSLPFPS